MSMKLLINLEGISLSGQISALPLFLEQIFTKNMSLPFHAVTSTWESGTALSIALTRTEHRGVHLLD